MSKLTFEQRLAALEREVAALKKALAAGQATGGWRWMLDYFEQLGTLAEALELVTQDHEITDAPAANPLAGSRQTSVPNATSITFPKFFMQTSAELCQRQLKI